MRYNPIYTGAMIAGLIVGGFSCDKKNENIMAPENLQPVPIGYPLPYQQNDSPLTKVLALNNMARSIRDSTGAIVQITVCNRSRLSGAAINNECCGVAAFPVQESTTRIEIELLDPELKPLSPSDLEIFLKSEL